MRQRQHWRPKGAAQKLVDDIHDIIHDPEYRSFWPLTLRQIYYALVSNLKIENTGKVYKNLVVVAAAARLAGLLPWEAIHDTARAIEEAGGYKNLKSFIQSECDNFMRYYRRHITRDQPKNLEIWIEKAALKNVFEEVTSEFGLTLVVARGYSSVSFVNDLRERIDDNRNNDSGPEGEGRPTRILYFGDLDPSGMNMLPAMFRTLHEEMGVEEEDADYERVALVPSQVRLYSLPQNPNALKDDAWQARERAAGNSKKTKGDPRAEEYKRIYGSMAVELDALRPRQLQKIARDAIERNLDVRRFNESVSLCEKEEATAEELREKAREFLEKLADEALNPPVTPPPPPKKKKTSTKKKK